MSQPQAQQQLRRAIFLGIKVGGRWLVHLGIFAGLLWLSAWLKDTARVSRPDAPVTQSAEPAREDPFPDLPLGDADPRCSEPSNNNDVIPFYGSGMTQPVLISGAPLQYPPEALTANLRGLIIARCTLTCMGEVKHCRIIKRLPFMDQAVISMLESRRYLPVRYEGRPVNISYNFHIRIPQP